MVIFNLLNKSKLMYNWWTHDSTQFPREQHVALGLKCTKHMIGSSSADKDISKYVIEIPSYEIHIPFCSLSSTLFKAVILFNLAFFFPLCWMSTLSFPLSLCNLDWYMCTLLFVQAPYSCTCSFVWVSPSHLIALFITAISVCLNYYASTSLLLQM